MKLVNRVSAFFLVALALSLAGNGVLLWALVRHFLTQRFDQQLHAALHTLVAAVEVEEDDAKWEPSDHTIALGAEDGLDDVRWAVFSEDGRVIDQSRNLSPLDSADVERLAAMSRPLEGSASPREGWRRLEQRLAAPNPKPASERDSKEFAALRVVVARSDSEIRSSLRQLGLLVSGLSTAIWLVAAVAGRWYCGRALLPVRDMALKARDVTGADFRMRLPVGQHTDELTELGSAFNGLLDQLQHAFEKQRRFTGDAAHQLRTPLTVLLGQIDVALRRPRTADEYRSTLDLLRSETVNLQQVVEALLFLARVEGEADLPDVATRDAGAWLRDYATHWDGNPRRADLSLDAPAGIALTTSWPLLAQLLDNLVSNAFKYSPARTPVRLAVRRSSDDVAFEIEDRGIGIAAEDQASVFDPFFRSQTARQTGAAGTGLGLALSARITQALKGRLTVESDGRSGSCFRVLLPTRGDREAQ